MWLVSNRSLLFAVLVVAMSVSALSDEPAAVTPDASEPGAAVMEPVEQCTQCESEQTYPCPLCQKCYNMGFIFFSCFPVNPGVIGRCNCDNSSIEGFGCYESGAFCEIIIVG
jgi:hypothetical protein